MRRRSGRPESSRGLALVTVLVMTSLVLVMALGVAVVVSINQAMVARFRESVALGLAARAGVELAAAHLAAVDWQAVLDGRAWAPASDGPAGGTRTLPDGDSLDLDRESHRLTCGHVEACTDAQIEAVTVDRPWGANNPRWRLFLFGPTETLMPLAMPAASYLVVWVADDSREADGDARRDAAEGQAGHGVVRVRARAFGARGSRREADAEVVRVCLPAASGGPCHPGLRVHGLRDRRHVVP
jgi:hypothetical protein